MASIKSRYQKWQRVRLTKRSLGPATESAQGDNPQLIDAGKLNLLVVAPEQVRAARIRIEIAQKLGEPVDELTQAIAAARPMTRNQTEGRQ